MDLYLRKRDSIQTGDLLAFGGAGAASTIIKRFTASRWSHVGMAIRLPDFGDSVLVFESTTLSNVPDILTGKRTQGVQLVSLSERVENYDGEIAVRHIAPEVTLEERATLGKFRSEVSGRPYEESQVELLRSAWDGWGGKNVEDLSSVFCSELVAEALQRMGRLPDSFPSNEVTPADLVDRRFPGVRGVYPGPLDILRD